MDTDRWPISVCELGYTAEQVASIVGASRIEDFYSWMQGQTAALCTGTRWDSELRQEVPTVCMDTPHGLVYYPHDVMRYVSGLPVID